MAATSVVVNAGVKQVVRRRRPSGLELVAVRVGGRSPKTSSFPSSHTATAAETAASRPDQEAEAAR